MLASRAPMEVIPLNDKEDKEPQSLAPQKQTQRQLKKKKNKPMTRRIRKGKEKVRGLINMEKEFSHLK